MPYKLLIFQLDCPGQHPVFGHHRLCKVPTGSLTSATAVFLLRIIATVTIIVVVTAEKKSSSRNLESERNDLKVKNGRQFHTNYVDIVMDVSEI